MNRRIFLRLAMLTCCGLVCSAALQGTAAAQDSGEAPSLKDVLEKGLKARLPGEFAFVHRVVAAVHAGILPRDMVMSTFIWARRNPRPFPYFVYALKLRASDAGISF